MFSLMLSHNVKESLVMKTILRFTSLLILGVITLTPAEAALNIELTQGVASAIPIAVMPFTDEGQTALPPDANPSQVISADLSHSGQFNVLPVDQAPTYPHDSASLDMNAWQKKGADDIILGKVEAQGNNQYKVTVSLVNLYNQAPNNILFAHSYTVSGDKLRALAHHVSDEIYQDLTGIPGVFSTKLAYVLVQRSSQTPTQYKLMVADQDGYNPRPVLISSQPIMSPSWSPDGRSLAYVSFETYLPQIYISDLATGKRRLVTSFSGINGAPEWSPDGQQMAVALSKGGANPNLYTLNLSSGKLTAITHDFSINTEPVWAKDGTSLYFTSDRGGAPQIYQVNLASGAIQRLTFDGSYNASPSLSQDGTHLAVLNRQTGGFNIAILDLGNGQLTSLTQSGNNQSPSMAPNGKMIVYATKAGGRQVLAMVSADGKVNVQLPDQLGDVQEPAWSPFLS